MGYNDGSSFTIGSRSLLELCMRNLPKGHLETSDPHTSCHLLSAFQFTRNVQNAIQLRP